MLFNELHQGGIRALLDYDDTIFDGMVLPEGLDDEDHVVRTLIIDDIILRHGDTPLFIPEPTVMKYYVTSWSTKMLPVFTRFWAACQAEYDPIENYNRNESRSVSIGNTRTLNTNEATTGTDTYTETGTRTTENQVSAENVATFEPDNKTIETPNTTNTRTANLAVADTGTIADQGAEVTTSNIHGNIGVTTSQQMLESELTLVPKLDVIRFISDSWAAEFCLAVY